MRDERLVYCKRPTLVLFEGVVLIHDHCHGLDDRAGDAPRNKSAFFSFADLRTTSGHARAAQGAPYNNLALGAK